MVKGGPDPPTIVETIKKDHFSTADIPPKQQFDAFRAQVGASYNIAPTDGGGVQAFEQTRIPFGNMVLSHHHKRHGHVAVRDARTIRRDQNDSILIACLLSGTTLVDSEDTDHHLGPGVLWMRDVSLPMRAMSGDTKIINLIVPRTVFRDRGTDPRTVHARTFLSPTGALFRDHMFSLARNLESIPVAEAAQAAEMTELLLAAALEATSDRLAQASEPIGHLQRERAIRYIERNLLASTLTPETIASATGVSRRKLYQLFEGSGGVMREIQARRLNRARAALTNPIRPMRVKEAAFLHGFESEAHFSRSFKRMFGFNPSEAASGGDLEPRRFSPVDEPG
jgi:AraC-like DNA-binding protein